MAKAFLPFYTSITASKLLTQRPALLRSKMERLQSTTLSSVPTVSDLLCDLALVLSELQLSYTPLMLAKPLT
jgi:hypothetical protein